MKTNLKPVFSAFAGVCLITATLGACSTGTSRAPGQQQVRFQRSLVNATTQYTRTNTTGTPFGYGMGYGVNPGTTLGVTPGTANPGTTYGMNTGTARPGTTYGMNTGTARPGTTYGTNPGTTYGTNPRTAPGSNLGTTTGLPMTFNKQKADNIRMQLKKMNGVANANVVVMGNTALVGCRPTARTANATALKNSIARKVKQIDSTITNVAVSESPDIMTRMSKLSTGTSGSNPARTVVDEFNRIVREITPVVR